MFSRFYGAGGGGNPPQKAKGPAAQLQKSNFNYLYFYVKFSIEFAIFFILKKSMLMANLFVTCGKVLRRSMSFIQLQNPFRPRLKVCMYVCMYMYVYCI